MRRRDQRQESNVIPLRLRRYLASDWPDPECHPECAWWEAASEWEERYPDSLPDKVGPDTPFHPETI